MKDEEKGILLLKELSRIVKTQLEQGTPIIEIVIAYCTISSKLLSGLDEKLSDDLINTIKYWISITRKFHDNMNPDGLTDYFEEMKNYPKNK